MLKLFLFYLPGLWIGVRNINPVGLGCPGELGTIRPGRSFPVCFELC